MTNSEMKSNLKTKTLNLVKDYIRNESGATALEYGLIAALLGVGITVGASTLARNTDSAWNNMATKVEAAGS